MMRFEDLEVWKRAARLSADIYIKLVRFAHNQSRASLREPQSLTTRSCDWNDGTME